MEPPIRSIAAPLAHRVSADADASQLAAAVVEAWGEIDTALTPIIGKRGLAALYRRSIYIAAQAHPWLALDHDAAVVRADFSELTPLFSAQRSGDAVLGAATLFGTFHDLLGSMVGTTLTQRLLRPVWSDSSSGDTAKDIRP